MVPTGGTNRPDRQADQVLFNAYAPELWRRFTITLRRTLARQARLTNRALAAQVRVSYAKVAEYQRRGVVHFHVIIRLDGPAGPTTAPPAWAVRHNGQMHAHPEVFATRSTAEWALRTMGRDGLADTNHDRRYLALVLLATFASLRGGGR